MLANNNLKEEGLILVQYLRLQSIVAEVWRRRSISQLWHQEYEAICSYLSRSGSRKSEHNMGLSYNSLGLPYTDHLSLDRLQLLKAPQSPQTVPTEGSEAFRHMDLLGGTSHSNHNKHHTTFCLHVHLVIQQQQQWLSHKV